MSKVRDQRDNVLTKLREDLEASAADSRLPLDSAVAATLRMREQVRVDGTASSDESGAVAQLLDLFEVTSVSAALAIKHAGVSASDTTGTRDALVDLWGRSEAARSLAFDALTVWTGQERQDREADLWETARLLAPDAIAIAMGLSEPVSQYVEFASKVINMGQSPK